MKKEKRLEIKGMRISIFQKNKDDYISLTDIARYKNQFESKDIAFKFAYHMKLIYSFIDGIHPRTR